MKIFNKFISKRVDKIIGKNFAGCGSNCGCGTPDTKKQNEMNLKAMNYEIISNIEDGLYQEGLDKTNEYLKEIEKNYGEDSIFYTSGLNNKAFILKQMNKKDKAYEIYNLILNKYQIIKKTSEVPLENEIIVKQNLATILRDLKKNEEAIAIYENLFIYIDNDENIRPHIKVNILVSASGSYRAINQFKIAENLLNKAEKLIEENYGDQNLPMANVLNQKGLLFKDQQKFEEALINLKQSLELKESVLEKNHPEVLLTRENISQVYIQMGDGQAAKIFLDQTEIDLKNKKKI